jgi:hypothetical protein
MWTGDDEALPHQVAQQQPGIAGLSTLPLFLFATTGMGVLPP